MTRSDWLSRAVIRPAQNGVFDPALGPYARRLYALTLALSAIRVCWLPEGVAAAPAADAVLDQVPGDAAGWAAALAWARLGLRDAAEAAAVETLGRRLANAETLNPEERQRLSRQMATLRQQIAHPLVDPSWGSGARRHAAGDGRPEHPLTRWRRRPTIAAPLHRHRISPW